MRKRRKWLAALMTIAMLVTMIPAGAFAQGGEAKTPALEWQTSKSKTATNLDENYESDITLSLPSAQQQLTSDVVFVLDKSSSTDVRAEALKMLGDLKTQVETVGAKVNVGVVVFNKQANTDGELHDLVTEYDTIKEAIESSPSGGTNMHAGLLAAQQMMKSSSTPDERQYLIFVSDGLSYMFDEEPNAINSQQAATGEYGIMAGNDCWGIRHYLEGGDQFIPSDWNAYLTDVGNHLNEVQKYIQPYDNCGTDAGKQICIPRGDTELPTTVDVALYKTADVFSQMVDEYQCYTILAESSAASSYPWAGSFMSYLEGLSGNENVDFAKIQNDIYYLLDEGSTIDDYMGYVEGKDGYDFDMQIAEDNLYMTVETLVDGVLGEPQKYTATKIEGQDNTYGFVPDGEGYKYELTYYPGKGAQEHFTWKTNVPVTNFERVQLHYTVKLTEPQTAIGEYGQYDEDGSKGYGGLYTNDHATLTAVDTNGGERTEDFAKPTVSYTVDALTITPADITIYTGGDSYEGVVDDLEGVLDTPEAGSSEGLPEPGYYITLPDWLNDKVNIDEEGADAETGAADLSTFDLTFTYDGKDSEGNTVERAWPLELYYTGSDDLGTSYQTDVNIGGVIRDRYIYKLGASDGINHVRVQFTPLNENGTIDENADPILADDRFGFDVNSLYEKYDMTIYPGLLDQKAVKANITIDEKTYTLPVTVGHGTLTIRGASDEAGAVDISSSAADGQLKPQTNEATGVTTAVVASSDTKYYVNDRDEGSMVSVDPDNVRLLTDKLATNEAGSETEEQAQNFLKNHIVNELKIADADANYQYQYMDLVDTTNGNAWVTADQSVDIYWKLPDGASADDEFQIVHFQGLDREYDDVNTELGQNTPVIYSKANNKLSVETIDNVQYLKFSTQTFSPFVLVWDEASNDNPGGPVIPSDPSDPDPDTPDLNTDDHYSYIVGYPEDYRTGEATDDESLWPVKPQGNITRAEVATIFYRLLTNDARYENWTTSNSFTDVSADSWYNTPVSTLSAMGLIEGYEDGSFRPDNPITRAEFAAIAGRFFTDNDAIYEPGTFSDIEGAEWFADAVQAAKDHDIIGGYPDGSFKPNNPITRAEACSIVNRTTKRVPDADHLLALDQMRNWPDNANTSAWYYADMQEATNGHYYDYVLDENDEIVREEWTSAREPIDWDAVEAELEASH